MFKFDRFFHLMKSGLIKQMLFCYSENINCEIIEVMCDPHKFNAGGSMAKQKITIYALPHNTNKVLHGDRYQGCVTWCVEKTGDLDKWFGEIYELLMEHFREYIEERRSTYLKELEDLQALQNETASFGKTK